MTVLTNHLLTSLSITAEAHSLNSLARANSENKGAVKALSPQRRGGEEPGVE